MKIAPIALAAALAATPALANDPAERQRIGAVMIEWAVANCDAGGLPAVSVAMSLMVLNGADPKEIDPYRRRFRQGVAANYPDRAAACVDIVGRIAAR